MSDELQLIWAGIVGSALACLWVGSLWALAIGAAAVAVILLIIRTTEEIANW
jgi:predicted branched-subunit amino acid permease